MRGYGRGIPNPSTRVERSEARGGHSVNMGPSHPPPRATNAGAPIIRLPYVEVPEEDGLGGAALGRLPGERGVRPPKLPNGSTKRFWVQEIHLHT